MNVLLTTTSFQDTPGKHQDLLEAQDFVITRLRGPLTAEELLPIIHEFDAVICGDDEYTTEVLEKGFSGRLRYLSKYGVGLDKIDLAKAKELGIPVANCPSVNQVSVAEHVFALLLAYAKHIPQEYNITKAGQWKRYVNRELYGKTLGIVGLGAIGKEVAKRAKAFGLEVIVYDKFPPTDFIVQYNIIQAASFVELAQQADILTLHTPLTAETSEIINTELINTHLKKGAIIINTARGGLVNTNAIIDGLKSEKVGAYLADVLDIEPMPANYALKDMDNVIITPHISSRTYESVERQGSMAVKNLIELIRK